MSFGLIAVLFLGLLEIPIIAQAQQSASLPLTEPALSRTTPAKTSKTELANRFKDIKTRYDALKTAAAKFVPLNGDVAAELRVVRSKISAAMHSYVLYEVETQKQRDQLNLLTDLSEIEAKRLQMGMNRLSKMSGTISSLMKQINTTGDALAQTSQ